MPTPRGTRLPAERLHAGPHRGGDREGEKEQGDDEAELPERPSAGHDRDEDERRDEGLFVPSRAYRHCRAKQLGPETAGRAVRAANGAMWPALSTPGRRFASKRVLTGSRSRARSVVRLSLAAVGTALVVRGPAACLAARGRSARRARLLRARGLPDRPALGPDGAPADDGEALRRARGRATPGGRGPPGQVAALEWEQGILGRLLGYGTIVAGDFEVPYVPARGRMTELIG